MEISLNLIIIILLGVSFFTTAVYMLAWATRKGQMRDFEAQANSIFTEDEPLGVKTDFFPDERRQVLPHRNFKTK